MLDLVAFDQFHRDPTRKVDQDIMGSVEINHILEDPKHGGSKSFTCCGVAKTKCGISCGFNDAERKLFELIHNMSNDNMCCCSSNRLMNVTERGFEWEMGQVGHSFLVDKGMSLLAEVQMASGSEKRFGVKYI